MPRGRPRGSGRGVGRPRGRPRGSGSGRRARGSRGGGGPSGRRPGRPRGSGSQYSYYQRQTRPWEIDDSDDEVEREDEDVSEDDLEYDDDNYDKISSGLSSAVDEDVDDPFTSDWQRKRRRNGYKNESPGVNSDEYDADYLSEESDAVTDDQNRTDSIGPRKRPRSPEPVRCVWLEERSFPTLRLPKSSDDLLLPKNYVLSALDMYEVCRRFGNSVKLSPFLFEDFCACLAYRGQNPLLDEIHLALLRSLLKEDDSNQVLFGPHEVRDSINISTHIMDQYTYAEILRRYVESDDRFPDSANVLAALSGTNYPFTTVEHRLTVLRWLCQQFLLTQQVRAELIGEGVIQHDDHCRECGKLGDLLCCDTCPAVYHMECCDPPVEIAPSSGWQCEICILHDIKGVSDCRTDAEKMGQLVRQGPLGYDRNGRRYMLLVRRIFIEDDSKNETWYYSTLTQLRQLVSILDPDDLEKELCESLVNVANNLFQQMYFTEEFTERRRQNDKKAPTVSYLSADRHDRLLDIPEETYNRKSSCLLEGGFMIDDECPDNTCMSEFLTKLNAEILKTKNFDASSRNFVSALNYRGSGPRPKPYMLTDDDTGSGDAGQLKMAHPSYMFNPGQYFKLGQDKDFMKYANQYTANPLAKNPYTRAEERHRAKYMSNRFLMEEHGEFKWPFDLATSMDAFSRMIKTSLSTTAARLTPVFCHPHWNKSGHHDWKAALNAATDAYQLGRCLAQFESNIRSVTMSETYRNSLGHTKFYRTTAEDREERQRKEKVRRKDAVHVPDRLADPTDESSSVIWVKYTLLNGPPKHQIWKQRDEMYRVNGEGKLGGWIWSRKYRTMRHVPQSSVGLAAGPIWEFHQGEIIDNLIVAIAQGYTEPEEQFDPNMTDKSNNESLQPISDAPVIGGVKPLCATLPMEFNEMTASFEVNRSKAVEHLDLRLHSDTIDISLGLAQHSVYYKIAKGSKFLDRLILDRMRQEEQLQQQKPASNSADQATRYLRVDEVRHTCYSSNCRNGVFSGSGRTCYSPNCRLTSRLRSATTVEATALPHKLQLAAAKGRHQRSFACWEVDSGGTPPPPRLHTFQTNSAQPRSMANVLLLPTYVIRRLARKFGVQETIEGFSHTAKANAQVWCYPCIRPTFQTCWRYHLRKAESLHAIALLLRIVYHNIRWDQLAVSKDFDISYVEKDDQFTETRSLIGHQLLPPFGLRAKYRIQITRMSNDYRLSGYALSESLSESPVAEEEDEEYTRQSAPWQLRERKAPRSSRVKNFEKLEQWVEDDSLFLWEIKNYWLRRERDEKLDMASRHSLVDQHGRLRDLSTRSSMAGITVTSGVPGLRLNATQPIISNSASAVNSIRVGTAANRIVINQQPIIGKPNDGNGPPVLQPQVNVSSSGGGTGTSSAQQSQVLAIPSPKPNTAVLVKTPDGRTLLVSNKPQTPGGQCVLTYQYVQLPLTSQSPTTVGTSQAVPQRVSLGGSGSTVRVQPTSTVARQPSLIRSVPSVTNDHVYRGQHSPPVGTSTPQTMTNVQGRGAVPLPRKLIQTQPQPQQLQRQASWSQDEYYEDESVDSSRYFDDVGVGDYAVASGTAGSADEYFMEGEEDDEEIMVDQQAYLHGSVDGPPELEPAGSVPFLRSISGSTVRRLKTFGNAPSIGRLPGAPPGITVSQTGVVVGQPAVSYTRRSFELREKEERKRLQECKTVLNRIVDEVVEADRQRKRDEAKHRPKKSRTEYWRQYRLKRKFQRMQDDELNKRVDLWRREICKRRENVKIAVSRDVQRHLSPSVVSRVVNERARLGWTVPPRPPKRTAVDVTTLASYGTSRKRSRYDSTTGSASGLDFNAASSSFPFGTPPYDGGVGVSEASELYDDVAVEDDETLYKQAAAQHEEDQRAAEAIMGLAAAGAASSSGQQIPFDQQLHCICRTQMDRTKFYVMCDLCGRWFHGKCVGISERKSKQMSTWSCRDCQKEKEKATQELYCICRTPYDESQPYICCDACDGWFHCHCVGVSPAEADTLPSFLCPNCDRRSAVASNPMVTSVGEPPESSLIEISPLSAIVKKLDVNDYRHLSSLTRSLIEHQMSWPFRRAIDPQKIPSYYQIIKDPIDLATVELRVKRRQYNTLTEFARDVATIFNNARSYYPRDSPEFQCATMLDQYFTKELHDVKLAIAAMVAEHQQHQQMLDQSPINWNGRSF